MGDRIGLSGVPETMLQTVYARAKESRGGAAPFTMQRPRKSFTWGVKSGEALAALLPDFRFVEEHSLCEGMASFAPIYKLLDKLSAVGNISNKIVVLERG